MQAPQTPGFFNHVTIQSEGSLSPVDWMNKQQKVLQDNEWGGDLEIRPMVIGLKKKGIVILLILLLEMCLPGSTLMIIPPVSKMKDGLFIPLICDELYAPLLSCDSLIIYKIVIIITVLLNPCNSIYLRRNNIILIQTIMND